MDFSFNPVTGCLGPRNDGVLCPYCYASRIASRFAGGKAFPRGFEPTFHEDRLRDPMLRTIPAGSRVFVGSMTDLGAPWAAEYLERILAVVATRPDVTFIFLTKQPEGFAAVTWPDNCWVGMTYTGQGVPDYYSLKHTTAAVRFVSFEPLLDLPCFPWEKDSGSWLQWVIVGAQTGQRAQVPEYEWVAFLDRITKRAGVPLFMKSSLRPLWDGEWRQEYPA